MNQFLSQFRHRKGEGHARIAGYLDPDVPTMLSFPTFPRRRKSNIVRPTTPTFLSEPEAPPPTKPVVYSPVPTMRTLSSLGDPSSAGFACSTGLACTGIESIFVICCISVVCSLF